MLFDLGLGGQGSCCIMQRIRLRSLARVAWTSFFFFLTESLDSYRGLELAGGGVKLRKLDCSLGDHTHFWA